jgi:hypothetical protein
MTKEISSKKSFFQKRIPTLIGLGILVIALVAGTFLFSQGTGVFAPRATPQTTPKKIRVTNLTDSGFSVSFLTDESTVGHVKYGDDLKKINSQASDDRDQLSGTIDEYKLHHVTVRGLEPNSTYYYTLGTGSGGFDNNGQPFSIKTAQRTGVPSAAKTVYGSVVSPSGNPAEGAIVYIKTEGVGEMSSLVKNSGSWAIPLSNARLTDGSTYAQISDSDALTIFVQGTSASLTSQIAVGVANSQPVASVTLGQSQNLNTAQETLPPTGGQNQPLPTNEAKTDFPSNEIANLTTDEEATPSEGEQLISILEQGGGIEELISGGVLTDGSQSTAAAALSILDLEQIESASATPTININQPKITGKAAPNVIVSIQVHSDTQIDQYIVADDEGNFELDISQLEQELEPGEHTVSYSYEDPVTGETINKTQTFYVAEDTSNQLAQADTAEDEEEYPYSSSSPYPIDEATQSAEATGSAIATDSGRTTIPSTKSAVPVSGSVGTTYALILGGLFFILAGVWSWWIASNLEEELAV